MPSDRTHAPATITAWAATSANRAESALWVHAAGSDAPPPGAACIKSSPGPPPDGGGGAKIRKKRAHAPVPPQIVVGDAIGVVCLTNGPSGCDAIATPMPRLMPPAGLFSAAYPTMMLPSALTAAPGDAIPPPSQPPGLPRGTTMPWSECGAVRTGMRCARVREPKRCNGSKWSHGAMVGSKGAAIGAVLKGPLILIKRDLFGARK